MNIYISTSANISCSRAAQDISALRDLNQNVVYPKIATVATPTNS